MKNSILKIIVSATLLFCGQLAFAQEIIRCATYQLDSIARQKSPQIMQNRLDFERQIQSYLADYQRNARVAAEVIKIPVVVHVIHNNVQGVIGGTTNTNISDEQIFSEIKVLNEDYRKKASTLGFNTNPVGVDTEIEFFLALRDPDGNATNGITRTYSSQTSFSPYNSTDQDRLAGLSSWDSNKYLNIWVCKISGGVLGWTQFPGAENFDGLDPTDGAALSDGVYIDYRAFGKKIGTSPSGLYSFGRTTTHEIGHFFGLIHTWGDQNCGTDYCNDTPQAAAANQSKFCTDVFSNCSGSRTRNMIENYMDYSPDSCMNIFTNDQKTRMRAVMELSKRRKKLINYAKSLELPVSDKLDVLAFPNPAITDVQLRVLFKDFKILRWSYMTFKVIKF